MKQSRTKSITFERVCAAAAAMLFLLSLLPIAMVAPYARSTGDDLNYSAGVHHALAGGEGWRSVLAAVRMTVKNTWHSWQGTWSSVALFSLQPGIWGNQYYPITVPVALVCILGGTGYFLHVVGSRRGITRSGGAAVFSLTGLLLVQYMPNMQCGLFWWTSVAHYCIPYGVTLLCMGWSLRFLDTGRVTFLAGCCIGMAYLGGAGYPEVVLGAVWLFLLMLVQVFRPVTAARRQCAPEGEKAADRCRMHGPISQEQRPEENVSDRRNRWNRRNRAGRMSRRFCWLILPFALEMAGFAVSAVAPGNRNRGGESFGFSVGKVLWTLAACMREGITETAVYFVRVRPLLPLLVILVLLLLLDSARNGRDEKGTGKGVGEDADKNTGKSLEPRTWEQGAAGRKCNLGAILAAGFVICIVRAPVLYAGTDASGGVPDSYWFITVTALVWLLETILGPQRNPRREAVPYGNPSEEASHAAASGNPSEEASHAAASGNPSEEASHAVASGTLSEEAVHTLAAGKRADDACRESRGGTTGNKTGGETGGKQMPRQSLYQAGIVVISVFLLLMLRHLVGSTVDYACVRFVRSGALADYHAQMEEWLDILEDPDIAEAELPAMNDEQGPFMLMVPLDDPAAWSSSVYARYYGKQSVVCVPRE